MDLLTSSNLWQHQPDEWYVDFTPPSELDEPASLREACQALTDTFLDIGRQIVKGLQPLVGQYEEAIAAVSQAYESIASLEDGRRGTQTFKSQHKGTVLPVRKVNSGPVKPQFVKRGRG